MKKGSIKNLRNKTLVGAIVTALAFGAAGTAAAAPSAYELNGGTQSLSLQQYLQALVNQQDLTSNVSADVLDSDIGYRGPAADGSLVVSNNAFQAVTLDAGTGLLGANGADNAVDLALLGTQDPALPAGDPNQGIGVLSGQLMTGDSVSTRVMNAGAGLDIADYADGNAVVTGNTLNATSVTNNAGNRVAGALDTSFGSDRHGDASVSYGVTPSESLTGGVVIGNAQLAGGVDGSARVTGSSVVLVNTMSALDYSSAPVTVTGNAATAAVTGNQGDNRFAASAGKATSYAGSVTLANGQANIDGSSRAVMVDTEIGASLNDTLYSGQADVSGNHLAATAQGNDAGAVGADGSLVRGNAISFGAGIDVAGTGSAGSVSLDVGNDTVDVAATGDLALVSSQGNQDRTIIGRIAASNVGIDLTTLQDGSLTLTDNRADAGAGGNDAINLISAQGSSFDATASAGNQQTNDGTTIRALAEDLEFGARIGGADTNEGDVTIGASGVTASASGNSAQTLVDLQGTQFAADPGGAVATGSNAGDTSMDIAGGIAAGNQQANYGDGIRIEAAVDGVNLGVGYAASGVYESNVGVDGNAVSATSGGNSARTSIAAGGTSGALSAALGSGQYNANDIVASINDGSTYIDSAGDLDGSHLSLGDNAYRAAASANQASNSLATTFDSGLALGGGTFSSIDTTLSSNTASAGLVLLNDQINNDARVRTSVDDVSIQARTQEDIHGSSIDLHANTIGTSASGNVAGNSLTPDAGNLVRSTGDGILAALGNLQQMSGNAVATVDDADIGVQVSDYSQGFTGTLADNRISAFAGGNLAGGAAGETGNLLHVSGTNLVDADSGTASSIGSGSQQDAVAAFVLQNAQSSTSGVRNAEIEQADITDFMHDMQDVVLSVGDNSIGAEARDNRAASTLSLDGFSNLTTTAALTNTQVSAGSMNGSVGDASIGVRHGIGPDDYQALNSSLTISGNAMSATTVANAATNQLAVDATQLGGAAADSALPAAAPAGFRGAVLDGAGGSLVVADYGINSRQARSGDVDASVYAAEMGADIGEISGTSDATVTGNAMTAFGQANSAGNTLALSGSGIDATAAIYSDQSADSDVDASVQHALIGIAAYDGADSAMPLTVTGNSMAAVASLNSATNALGVSADASVAGSVGLAAASDDAALYDDYMGAVGDFVVANFQGAGGSAHAALQDAQAGIAVDGAIGDTGGDSSLTVSGNQLAAEASGNSAGNSVALNGGSSVGATAALQNRQTMAGTGISAEASGIAIAAGNQGGNFDIDRAALTVADNRVSTAASGNSASNAVSVASAALNGPAVQGSASSSVGMSTAIADYALNSVQSNQTAISSTVDGVDIGVNIFGSDGAVNGGMATIGRNAVLASASGNSAGNSIMLASVNGSTASAALTNTQRNEASVTASIQDAHIGMHAGVGSSVPVTVTGNAISASATGNSAVNHIGIGK